MKSLIPLKKNQIILITVASLIIISVAIIYLRLPYAAEPFERDLTSYAYTAHYLLEGEKLYSFHWDQKPPGIYIAYMFADFLWGYGAHSIVNLGIFFTIISLIFLFLFLKEISNLPTAILGGVFWALASNSILLQANAPNVELVMNSFMLIAFWGVAKYRREKPWYLLIVGTALALGSVLKMIMVFPFIAIFLYLTIPLPKKIEELGKWAKENAKKLILMSIPGAIVWISIFLYFFATGRFIEFWEAVFVYNTYYAGSMSANIFKFITAPNLLFHGSLTDIWVLILIILAWPVVSQSTYGSVKRPFFIFTAIALIVSLASPGKYFPHYYQLLLPLIVIVSALFFFDLSSKVDKKIKVPVLALLITATFLHLSYYQVKYINTDKKIISQMKYGQVFVDSHKLGIFVKENTTPCDTLFEWGGESGIRYYSERWSPSGLVNLYPLFIGPDTVRQEKLRKVFEWVTNSPPKIFIWNSEFGEFNGSIFHRFVAENYEFIKQYSTYTIYKHKGKATPRPSKECST